MRCELDSGGDVRNVGAVIPRDLNAAHWFVDRHVEEGRDDRLAIIHEGRHLTYGDVHAGGNRLGSALRRPGPGRGPPRGLLLHDTPVFVLRFWGPFKKMSRPVP